MGVFRGVELSDLTLTSDRLVLRRWRADDAERVHAVMQDPSMHEFLALPRPYTDDAARDFVTGRGHEGRDEGTGLGSAVVERATGRVVGACALRLTGDPEIGYWTAHDARGHGYAAESTRILTAWAFATGLPRVRLVCDVRNLASVRTALSAGFAFEGVGRGGITSPGGDGVEAHRGDLARFAMLDGDRGDPIKASFAPLPGGSLGDGVLALRAMRPDDAVALHEAEDELAVGWGFDGAAPQLADTARTAAHAGLNWLVGGTAQFAMQDVETGAFAGELQLRKAGPPGIGGLGYTVHPGFRGRGYTTRALRLVVPWAFDVAGFARLELGAKRDNVASQRAALAAGFVPDGIREHRLRNPDGTFADEVTFALVNPADQ